MRHDLLQPDHLNVYRLRPHVAAMVALAIVNCGGSIRSWPDWPDPRTGTPEFETMGVGR
jgi:hypothetical protein